MPVRAAPLPKGRQSIPVQPAPLEGAGVWPVGTEIRVETVLLPGVMGAGAGATGGAGAGATGGAGSELGAGPGATGAAGSELGAGAEATGGAGAGAGAEGGRGR